MGLLYRGVCDEVDQENAGELRPKGKHHEVSMRRDGKIKKRDGKFDRFPSENNGARAHQVESGLYDGCYVSFTRSEEIARRFANRNRDGKKTPGYVYVADEDLLLRHGVVAHEFPDPEFPEEMEVTLRASDNGNLPAEIVIKKFRHMPKTYNPALNTDRRPAVRHFAQPAARGDRLAPRWVS